ncbi:hypothetical protein [Nonomuraea glycinis]|uniref:hypothetical protein n=1 Tax=Nonomuraea glycinis TaxID=2047744 RepID=UPI002E0F41E1|nr:hypothetical protein OHA68_05015 [Nonomuraea glycinis]
MPVPAPPARKRMRGLWLVVPPLLATLASLIGAVFPGGSLYVWSYAFLFWLIAAGCWGVLLYLPGRRRHAAVAVAPVLAVVTCGAMAADLPIRVAFAVSEPALSDYVSSLPLHPESMTLGDAEAGLGVDWVGVFPVGRAVRHEGSSNLSVIGAGGWLEFCGLTYATGDGKIRSSSVDHLSGRWYVTCDDF